MQRCFSYLLTVALLSMLSGAFANTVYYEKYNQASYVVPIAVADIPRFFSPYARTPLESQYAHLFFDPLVRWGKERQLEKRLLKKWQTIKPGVIRFYLKQHIQFHSGNQLSSDDVIWTFLQILKNPLTKDFFAGIASLQRVDQYTFDIHSSLPQARLFDYLTHFFVLDKTFYTRRKIDVNKAADVINDSHHKLILSGTGPYKIKQYNPALHLNVLRNKDYWQGPASIAELKFIKIKSADSRLFASLASDVDISVAVPNKNSDTVRFASGKSLIEIPSAEVMFFTINDKKSPVLKDSRARKAIHLAINQQGMLKHIINDMGSVHSMFIPVPQAKPPLQNGPVYDAPQAKKLLSKLALPEHLTLLVLVDQMGNTPQVTSALVNMMNRVGIKLRIREVTDRKVWDKLFFDYDFTLSVWQSSLLVRDNIYNDLFTDSVLANFINTLFAQAQSVDSVDKPALFFEQLQKQQRLIPLLVQKQIWAADKKYNVADIFSANAIPYWQLLTLNAQ